MSVNTAHASNGVLLHTGEYILLHSDNVSMDFSGQDDELFKGTKQGRIYLTTHRMVFNSKKPGDLLQSFSAPFITLSNVELEQPVFGANYIKAKVRAQPNGNFIGEVKFKLYFKAGGAIEYGQALARAAGTTQQNMRNGNYGDDPPPYTPTGEWHQAPPLAYQPPPGYYGWLPQHEAFSTPPSHSVFVSDNPPPYPGIGAPPPYNAQPTPHQADASQQYNTGPQPSWNGFSAPPPGPPQAQSGGRGGNQPPPYSENPCGDYGSAPPASYYQGPAYPQSQGFYPNGYPNQSPFNQHSPHGGFAAQQGGYPAQQGGYPPQQGYPPHQGYPPQQGVYPPQQGGYPPQHGGYPPQQSGFPPGSASGGAAAAGVMGFSAPPNSKEAEALASTSNSALNQRANNPVHSDMPPAYHDLPPPNYDDAHRTQ